MTVVEGEPVERVRVGRFEWERLMLSSSLPWSTKSLLLVLAVFMSENGGDARPGHEALMAVAERGRTTVYSALRSAVDAGYLIEVERGGFRKATTRASEYAAAVPKAVAAEREAILSARPWKRPRDSRSVSPLNVRESSTADEVSTSRTFVAHEVSVSRDEVSVSGDEVSAHRTPPRTYTTHPHHPEPKSGEGDWSEALGQTPDTNYVREVQALRTDWTPRLILDALSKAEQDGRDPAHCREALLRLARGDHGNTKLPARLASAGPWWEAVIPRPKIVRSEKCPKHPDRFADCGICAREKPRCIHGAISGTEPLKPGGAPRCALCRAETRKAEAA